MSISYIISNKPNIPGSRPPMHSFWERLFRKHCFHTKAIRKPYLQKHGNSLEVIGDVEMFEWTRTNICCMCLYETKPTYFDVLITRNAANPFGDNT